MVFNKLFKRRDKKDLINRVEIFKRNKGEDYLFEEVMIDKKGKEVHLVVTYIENNEGCGVGKIHIFSYIKNIEEVLFTINEDILLIGDIQIFENKDRGIGSKSIEILEKIAIKHNVFKIRGKLYSADEENRERQIHFYTKNGFKIMGTSLEKEIKS